MKQLYESILDNIDVSDGTMIINGLVTSKTVQEYDNWMVHLIELLNSQGFRHIKRSNSGRTVCLDVTDNHAIKFFNTSANEGLVLLYTDVTGAICTKTENPFTGWPEVYKATPKNTKLFDELYNQLKPHAV